MPDITIEDVTAELVAAERLLIDQGSQPTPTAVARTLAIQVVFLKKERHRMDESLSDIDGRIDRIAAMLGTKAV